MHLSFKTFAFLMTAAALAQPALAQDHADGARLAEGCSACHGLQGIGGGAIPAIAGKQPDEFVALMLAFRDQSAPATIMNRLARGYTDDEIAALADYFSAVEAK